MIWLKICKAFTLQEEEPLKNELKIYKKLLIVKFKLRTILDIHLFVCILKALKQTEHTLWILKRVHLRDSVLYNQ
jgi:hypothetical protein